jgi:hypothetical protein
MSASQPLSHFPAVPPQKEAVMAEFAPTYTSARLQSRERQKRMCQRLVQATCVFFIPVVLVRRLANLGGAPRPGNPSILAEARASASAVIPFIFMG